MAEELSTPTIVDISTTALQFLRWAHDNGLLVADAYYPGETVPHPNFGSVDGKTAVGVLRNRQVRFLALNPSAGNIVVFLRKAAPTAKELKVLPVQCNGYSLRYLQGNPEAVTPANVSEATSTCAVHLSMAGLRHYTCGSSISIGNNREAGTIGCLVKDALGHQGASWA